MNQNPEQSKLLNQYDAATEAALIYNQFAPSVRATLGARIRSDQEDLLQRGDHQGADARQKLLNFLDATAYIDLGSQYLEQMAENDSELYHANMTRTAQVYNLADTIAPSYVDLNEDHHIPPGQRRLMANQQPLEVRAKAFENALQAATVVVNRMVDSINSESPLAAFGERKVIQATTAMINEVENGHILDSQFRADQAGPAIAATIATRDIMRLQPKAHPTEFDIHGALEKQHKFNQGQQK